MKHRTLAILTSLALVGIAAPVVSHANTPKDSRWGPPIAEGDTRGCPGARCRNVKLNKGISGCSPIACRLAADPDGITRIPYWINPKRPANIDSPYTDAQVISYIRFATRTWEYASPSIRFIYKGTTDRIPDGPDGYNDFGFFGAFAGTAETPYYANEFDINLSATSGGRFFAPCRFHCPAVEPYQGMIRESVPDEPAGKAWREGTPDGVGFLVHEIGHALGFDHPDENSGCATMSYERYGGCDPDDDAFQANPVDERFVVSRHISSPALGELLAMRFLYPYTCPPTPKGYREGKNWSALKRVNHRTWLPWRYRQVCPTIAVPNP